MTGFMIKNMHDKVWIPNNIQPRRVKLKQDVITEQEETPITSYGNMYPERQASACVALHWNISFLSLSITLFMWMVEVTGRYL